MAVTSDRFVIDTNAALYLLGGRLAQPLPDGRYWLSVISELELLAYPDLTPSEETHIQAFLQDMAIVELNDTVKPMPSPCVNDIVSSCRMPWSPQRR
jgi:hypothetical protein